MLWGRNHHRGRNACYRANRAAAFKPVRLATAFSKSIRNRVQSGINGVKFRLRSILSFETLCIRIFSVLENEAIQKVSESKTGAALTLARFVLTCIKTRNKILADSNLISKLLL